MSPPSLLVRQGYDKIARLPIYLPRAPISTLPPDTLLSHLLFYFRARYITFAQDTLFFALYTLTSFCAYNFFSCQPRPSPTQYQFAGRTEKCENNTCRFVILLYILIAIKYNITGKSGCRLVKLIFLLIVSARTRPLVANIFVSFIWFGLVWFGLVWFGLV